MDLIRALMMKYCIGPPIFADLALDTSDGIVILDVERPGWLEEMRERQSRTIRAGLVRRDTGVVPMWLSTNAEPFEYFSRVVGRISNNGHVQRRKACIKTNDREMWLDEAGNVEILEISG